MLLFFYVFTLRSIYRKCVTASIRHCSVCQQSTWYSETRTRSWTSLYLKGYTAKRLTDEFLTDSPVGLRFSTQLKTLIINCLNVLRGLPLPGHLTTVPVSRNFFVCLLTPNVEQLFLRKFVCQPLCCIPPSNTNILIKILSIFYHICSISPNDFLIFQGHDY